MKDSTILVDGFYFPIKDEHFVNKFKKHILTTEELGPRFISKFCKNKKIVVQAGGNCGIYSQIYSEIFETVYTFEPDPINFFCLVQNIKNTNVIKFQSCLGSDHKLVSVDIDQNIINKKGYNCGTFQVSGNGNIPTLKIDDLALESCDLIHLDIEGFEGFAIQGAIETIKKFKPVICLEINGLLKKYGWDHQKLNTLMLSLGYEFNTITESDHVYMPL
jgi:FkbM family methyltransferase